MASKEHKRLRRNDQIIPEEELLPAPQKQLRFNMNSNSSSIEPKSNAADFYGNIAETYFEKWKDQK